MLQSMRQLAHSWLFKGLMLLLVVSFGVWGIGDMFRGNPLHRTVAKAGATVITVQELNREFEQTLARARQLFGPDMTAQQAKQMGLADKALNGLIETALVDQDLKRLGIEVDDRAVFQQLMQDPQFKDKDGKFDRGLLQNLLAQARVGEHDFLNQQRKVLASRQLISPYSSLPPAPQSAVAALYKARGQKRILDVVTLDNASVRVADTPDDKALRDFHRKNPQAFTMPETRGMTIALLSIDAVAQDIAVGDDQVKKEYDAKGAQLAAPEKRDLLQVVLQDEGKAKELATAAKASGNLASAAKPTGHEVVPLGLTEEDNLLPELAKPVFALREGGITEPVRTALGWHVLQVRKIVPAGMPKFEDIKETLRTSLRRDQAVDAVTRLVNQLDDELAAGHALEDVADGMKLRLIKIPALDAAGKAPDGKAPPELPYKDDVLKAAFAQNSGETSPVMDDKNGSYFVVRTDNVTPSTLKPFEQVKAEVLAAWTKQAQAKQAEAEAEAIAKALREGKPASSFAARGSVQVRTSKPLSLLGDSDPELPKTALPQIFKLRKGEVAVLPQPGRQMILRLAEIVEVGDKKDADAEDKIAAELGSAAPKELADEYVKHLRVLFPVTIRRDALDSIAPQGG